MCKGLGKLQGGMLTANMKAMPEWLMNWFATRSVDWWIMSEDLPDPNNRVSVDGDGKIRLSYTPNNLKSHGELVKHWTKLMRSMGYPIIIHAEDGYQGRHAPMRHGAFWQ